MKILFIFLEFFPFVSIDARYDNTLACVDRIRPSGNLNKDGECISLRYSNG